MAVVKELDKRPIHTPYVTARDRKKTVNGFQEGSAYLRRFYSTIDAEIYFGDYFVECCNAIDWTVQQNTQPLFGYNSYVYDEVAQGNRIIQGSFGIVSPSPNYLYKILEEAKQDPITTMESYVIPTHERIANKIVGAVNTDLQGEIENPQHNCIWPQTFDIDVMLGQSTGVGDPVHLVIQGVKIMSCHHQFTYVATNTVVEAYTFVARDIKTIG